MKRFGIGIVFAALLLPHAAGSALAVPNAPASSAPASAAPAPSASVQLTTANASGVVRETLANGMRVILLPNALAPVVTTYMTYGVGSIDDTMPGIAHATEHMMFRGTETLSAGQLADIAARMGAEYNAGTGDTLTLYYYKIPSAYTNVVLHIEADRMTHATILPADWATERGAIEQEIRAQQSQPIYTVGTKLRQTFFEGTPFANASAGTVSSFEKMTAPDIQAFYRAWYHPGNATLVVAGDIDPQQTLARVHAEFDGIPAVPVPLRTPLIVPPLANGTVQATIDFPIGFSALAYRLPGSDAPDYAASQVLAQVLSSGRGALADLTAQGKTLGVLSIANAFPELGASFVLALPVAGSTPLQAQALVAGVLAQYRDQGLPPELVDAAKARLLGEEAYREASISGLAYSWAEATTQRHTTPDAIYAGIARVTVDDVNRVMRTYLTAAHQLSIIVTAKPSNTRPTNDPSAAAEHVGFAPTMHEPLPAWAKTALNAPLRVPREDRTAPRRMPNGLHYIVRRETASPTVVVSGTIRNNPALYEPKGKDGVSLILVALLPWGTTTFDRKAYEAQFDAIAGSATLGTSFSLRVQAKDFERGMALLADGMLHPAFSEAAFGVVKSATTQSVALSNRLPATQANLAQRLALYPPGDPRRRDVTEATVTAIGLDDVRRYYRATFRPDETTIAVVGDVTPERARAALESDFGSWKNDGPAPSFRFPHLRPQAHAARTVRVKSASSAQSEVTLKEVFPMTRADPDYVPLLLANTILSGEGTGSLLVEELRTRRGFVYSAQSDFHVDPTGAEFDVSYASDPKNVAHTDAAVVAIIKQLQRTPLPENDLSRAKALLLAQRVLPLDSYTGIAADLLSGAQYGDLSAESEAAFWTALVRTTPLQLRNAMRRLDPDHFLRIIIEPDR